MIGSGKTVSQIAEELHLSVATISTHRAHILEKMNLTTTAELIHYAVSRVAAIDAALLVRGQWNHARPADAPVAGEQGKPRLRSVQPLHNLLRRVSRNGQSCPPE